jgi:phosphotransferase system  glucose/maltose/N-acetylglucosamine-specific IIC component
MLGADMIYADSLGRFIGLYLIIVGFTFAYLYSKCIRPTFFDFITSFFAALFFPVLVPVIILVVLYDNFVRR